MPKWYVLLDGAADDLARVKRLFTTSGFTFDHKDEKDTLSAPVLEALSDERDVIAAAMELLTSINTALRLSIPGYNGFGFHGLLEERWDGTKHRRMFAAAGNFSLSGAAAVEIARSLSKPVRSKEERLVSLFIKSEPMAELAVSMTAYPLTWGAMNTVYESAKGLMSTKTRLEDKRKDYQCLIDRGWITPEESNSFYKTAGHHRHGHPRAEVKDAELMDHVTASILVKKLFWHLVDELEPV